MDISASRLTMFDGPMAFVGASLNWFKNNFAEIEIAEAARSLDNVFELLTKKLKRLNQALMD